MAAKFKLGDTLEHVGYSPDVPSSGRWSHSVQQERYFVVSILTEECSGGEQYHYNCRPILSRGEAFPQLVKYNEVEMRLSSAFEPSAADKAVEAAHRKTTQSAVYVPKTKTEE